MGLPLGPTFANIFMRHHEQIWLDSCPLSLRPIFYQRFVDDTFLLFWHKKHARLFLNFLNDQHPNLAITMECESDGRLSFLDCQVYREKNGFQTLFFVNLPFLVWDLFFFSFCSFRFKINSIKTQILRGLNVCSNYTHMQCEFNFLKTFFASNGFPVSLVNSNTNSNSNTNQSEKLWIELSKLLAKYSSSIDFYIILVNNYKIGSLFPFKDKLPISLQSSLGPDLQRYL